jgi:hypothetical protein
MLYWQIVSNPFKYISAINKVPIIQKFKTGTFWDSIRFELINTKYHTYNIYTLSTRSLISKISICK